MTTNNHTPIVTGAAVNASVVNGPIGQVDAAIGNLTTLNTTPKTSVVAALGTSTPSTAAKTVTGAINELDTDIDSYTGRVGKVAGQRNWQYTSAGKVTWDETTKILSFSEPAFVLYGQSVFTYLRVNGPFTIDFSGIGANSYAVAYVIVTPGVTQNLTASDIKIENMTTMTNPVGADNVVVLAYFTNQTKVRVFSPFLNEKLASGYLNKILPGLRTDNLIYHCRGNVTWNSTTKVLSFSGPAYVFHGNTAVNYMVITGPFTIDFSAISSNSYGYAYVKNTKEWGESNVTLTSANIKVEAWTALSSDIFRQDIVILAWFSNHTKVRVWTPFVDDDIAQDYLNGAFTVREPWTNQYPQIYSKIPGFVQKYLAPADDLRVVLWGDSLFARTNHNTALSNPESQPPLILAKNIAYYIWKRLGLSFHTGIYKRYDTAGYFTETGSWSTDDDDAAWDDGPHRPGYTRFSAATNAAFAWTLGTGDDDSGCNLIYRTDVSGDAAATITVTQGNGYLEYWTGAAWAEANGATLSMKEVDEGARRGNTIYQARLKLRKAVAHANDSVTVTIGKASADADRLLYWGVELYDAKNGRYIVQLINSARGGHTFNQGSAALYNSMDDDVIDRDPDLVIVELPLLNMIAASGATKEIIVNSVQDVIWGDRAGAENVWSLKAQSSNWANFEVIVVVPSHSQAHFDASSAWAESFANVRSKDIYNAVKALLYSHDDVGVIDISTALLREMDADVLYNGAYYDGLNGTSVTGVTYTTDDIHPNDKGVLVWARHICPVLDCNAL